MSSHCLIKTTAQLIQFSKHRLHVWAKSLVAEGDYALTSQLMPSVGHVTRIMLFPILSTHFFVHYQYQSNLKIEKIQFLYAAPSMIN